MKNAKPLKPLKQPTETEIKSLGYFLVTGRVKISIDYTGYETTAKKVVTIFSKAWPRNLGPHSFTFKNAIYGISKMFGGPEYGAPEPDFLEIYTTEGLHIGYQYKLEFAPEHTWQVVNTARAAIIDYEQRETRKIREGAAEALKGIEKE